MYKLEGWRRSQWVLSHFESFFGGGGGGGGVGGIFG